MCTLGLFCFVLSWRLIHLFLLLPRNVFIAIVAGQGAHCSSGTSFYKTKKDFIMRWTSKDTERWKWGPGQIFWVRDKLVCGRTGKGSSD